MPHKTKHSETINHSEHIAPEITGDNIAAKKVANYVWNSGTSEWERMTPAAGGGGGTQYQEDAAASAGSTGNLLLAVRDDAGGSRVSTDGDFTALSIDSAGRLRTVVSGAGSGGTSSVDDTAFTAGTDAGTGAMGVYQSTPDSVDDGDIGVLGMTANRHLKVELQNTVDLGATDNAVLDSIDTAVNGTLTVDGSGVTQPISAASLPLPTGAATAANQSTIIGHVDGIETILTAIDAGKLEETTFTGRIGEVSPTPTANTVLGRLKDIDDALAGTITVDGSGSTQPISASALPLPAGAATAANQTTLIGHVDGVETLLGTIDADTSSINTNVATVAGAVSGSEVQVDIVSAPTLAVSNAGLTELAAAINTNQLDVNIASDSVGIGGGTQYTDDSVQATPTGTVALGHDGTNVRALNVDASGNLQAEVTNTVTVGGTVTANLSATDNAVLDAIEATLNSIETGQLADGHNVTIDNVSIPVTDNGGSLTVDGTVGVSGTVTVDGSGVTQPVSGTVTANLSATDNAVLDTIASNTEQRGSSSSVTAVNDSATSVQLLAANANRLEATITNDSSADLYIKLGTTASTTSYTVKISTDESYIVDKYTGRIDGIWATDPNDGAARVTEIS